MKRPITCLQAPVNENSNWTTEERPNLPALSTVVSLPRPYDSFKGPFPGAHPAFYNQSLHNGVNMHLPKPIRQIERRPLITETSYFPEVWVHPEDQYGKWLYDDIKGLSLKNWMGMMFQRDHNRVAYGEHSAKRQKLDPTSPSETDDVVLETTDSVPTCSCSNDPCRYKSLEECKKQVEHAIIEKDRRSRHSILQQETDKECAECHFDLASKRLPDLKAMLGHKENGGRKSNSAETGKDTQLFAAFWGIKMAKWVIMAHREMAYANEHGVAPQVINCDFRSNTELLDGPQHDRISGVVHTPESTAEESSSSSSATFPPRRKMPLRPREKIPRTAMAPQPTPPLSPKPEGDIDDRK